ETVIAEMKGEEAQETAVAEAPKMDPLGLVVQNLDEEVLNSMRLDKDTQGVLVKDVDDASAAYSQGIRPGDLIVEVDKKKVTNLATYRSAVVGKKKGDNVLLLIKRGANMTLYVAFTI